MTLTETMVRMGDFAASKDAGDVLVSIGLGSCIGLALLDPARGVAGLSHVMLPASPNEGAAAATPSKFADTAVEHLVGELVGLGARRARLEAVLVGGAQMFSFGGGSLDVGNRNAAGVRESLKAARLPIRAEATGGSSGRTIRVRLDEGAVSFKTAGNPETQLFSPRAARR